MSDLGPKQRNSLRTKSRILSAANDLFAEVGYSHIGVRDIARRADVASSLLARYFGNKAGLFEQALIQIILENSLFSFNKADFGTTMARLIQEKSNLNIIRILVLALADPEARDVAMRVSRDHIITPLADWLGPPNQRERAMNLYALMTGYVIQVQSLSDGKVPDQSATWLARTLQAIIEET